MEAARAFGLWAVSQELRVNYESLKSRLLAEAAASRSAAPAAAEPGFVTCSVADLLGVDSGSGLRTELELTSAGGARLVVRLGPRDHLDVVALTSSLWGAAR
ncbi:MAG: hypothetical protein IPM29_16885 [Planctomycetes bacterium]|nr:hypothetical protein [Planctomycetota bacterium]